MKPPLPELAAAAPAARGFRRERCASCALPVAGCICRAFGPLESRIEVRVVMPAIEDRSRSNTARLLGLWLPKAGRFMRGALDPDGSHAPVLPLAALDPRHTAVLFVDERYQSSRPVSWPPATTAALPPSTSGLALDLARADVRQLLVPDGTWAQARRIMRRDLAPLGLPRLTLDTAWPSIYELRRRPMGLCTFEAIALALGLLDSPELAAQLLERFSHWNERQAQVKRGGSGTLALTEPPAHPALARLRALTR